MSPNALFVIFISFCVFIVPITGQVCSPGPVQNIRITEHALLVWEPPGNNSCFISLFRIFMYHELGELTYTYHTGRTSLNLNFIHYCERYHFNITGISGSNLEGVETPFFGRVPFPVGMNLAIEMFSVSPSDNGVLLQWKIPDQWMVCADRYRITIVDEQSDNPVDIYVYSNYTTITGILPCTSYIFGVRAIYNLETEGPYTSTRYVAPPGRTSPPTLQSITVGTTTADLTWQLESYSLNRCPITSLTIDSSPYFKVTYPYVANQLTRPPISVHLTGLQPDTMYLLNVTVLNIGGTSDPVLVAIQTLENT